MLLPKSEVLPSATGTLISSSLASFLYTKVLSHCLPALLTLNRAAPVEFTITARHYLSFAFLHSQPALPAEPLAASLLPFAQVLALLEALSALCARQAQCAVFQAVIGGVFEVDQLLARDGVKGLCDGPPAGRAVPRSSEEIYLQSPVVLLLQVVPHFPEFWQLQPTGLSGAAS